MCPSYCPSLTDWMSSIVKPGIQSLLYLFLLGELLTPIGRPRIDLVEMWRNLDPWEEGANSGFPFYRVPDSPSIEFLIQREKLKRSLV